MRKLSFVLLVVLISCQQEIRPDVDQNPANGGNNNSSGSGKFSNCVIDLSESTFDIATWNIENFPQKNETTISTVADIIKELDADLIAVQEISESNKFNELVDELPGWKGVQSGGSLGIGFLYKTSEVSISSPSFPLNDASAFPRAPMVITATHKSGLSVTLINLHLKCCDDGDSIDRRKSASTKLKSYIDSNLLNSNVVMLGDYNEDITQPEGNDVLKNFVDDAANYKFADMTIAQGSSSSWSYPGWPSHLDHMLITKGLFDNVADTRVLLLNQCENNYYDNVSDHRPVLIRLNNN